MWSIDCRFGSRTWPNECRTGEGDRTELAASATCCRHASVSSEHRAAVALCLAVVACASDVDAVVYAVRHVVCIAA